MKKKIDYLNLIGIQGEKNKILFSQKVIAGINILQIEIVINRKETSCFDDRAKKYYEKKIKRKLKKYQPISAFGADEQMIEWLQIENIGFESRKWEFLKNRENILSYLKGIPKEDNDRTAILFVIKGKGWTPREIFHILFSIKDYYEDIYLVADLELAWMEAIENILYEEWGVGIHRLTEEEGKKQKVKAGLFFIEDANLSEVKKYKYDGAYVVFEHEKEKIRRVYMLKEEEQRKKINSKIYSGFVYQKEKENLPYQMGVNLMKQESAGNGEFSISIVAIYDVE